MGQGALSLRRRDLLLAGGASALLAACDASVPALEGGWVGASHARGHRLRGAAPPLADGPVRRVKALIVGGGVSGLACARELVGRGVDDVAVLELEDQAGGNSRGHAMAGIRCPLGAHYLPLPGPDAPEVYRLLEEFELVRQRLGRAVWDERHLCHSPQERLFFNGQWFEGLLPPAQSAATREQYLAFARAVDTAQRELGFAMPTHRARWTAGHAALDAQTFAAWLDAQRLTDAQLRWYLDYCCRDDYGAGIGEVSAWAGLHYFASRHGFHPPGADAGEREAVLTWPEGNGWLTARMAAELGDRVHVGHTVLRVEPGRHDVTVQAWNERAQAAERWIAERVVLATPLFIAARLLGNAAPALAEAATQIAYAPWLVANLQLAARPLERLGAPPAWDSVIYGSQALGYVDATHQDLTPTRGATVLTAYQALPRAERPRLLGDDWRPWAERIVGEMIGVHPDLREQLRRVDLMRWGHAMSIPKPGIRGSAALAALRETGPAQGRVAFAHSDLAGYSVFEEAYTRGVEVGAALAAAAGAARR